MKFTRVKAIAKKEFIHIFRDPRSLGMAIAIPMLMLLLFGKVLTFDVDDVPMIIWDQDNTTVSRDYILNFQNSPYFHIVKYFDNYKTIDEYIDSGKAIMALVVSKDFSKDIRAGEVGQVQLIVDGSDSNTAGIAMGYASSITANYNSNFVSDIFNDFGMKYIVPVESRPRVWFNPDLKSKNFIIPGLIAIIMMVISALLTSLTIAREWDRGTMEQLISVPVKKGELILGKLIPYFVISLFDVFVAFIVGKFIFDVPFNGNMFLFFTLSCLFLVGALCWGIFISILLKNQFLASQMAFISTFLPAFILSGFAFPIYNMPKIIQIFTYIIPTRYFITILRGIYLKGVGIKVLFPQVIFLVGFSFLMVIIANKKLKKRIS